MQKWIRRFLRVPVVTFFLAACYLGIWANTSKTYAAAVIPIWAKSTVAVSGGSQLESVSTDNSGNSYAAGYFYDTGVFNPGGVSNDVTGGSSQSNALIVKYNSSGVAQWTRTIASGNAVTTGFLGVSADASGNVYVAGFIYGTGTFDFGNGQTLTGPFPGFSSVIVKYNTSGVAQWARVATSSSGVSEFKSVSVDPISGDIAAAGFVEDGGAFDFGGSSSPVNGAVAGSHESTLVVVYDSSGTAQWAVTPTSATNDSQFSGVVAYSGDIFAVGYTQGNASIEFRTVPSVSTSGAAVTNNALAVRYNSSGNAVWADSTTAGNNTSVFNGVDIDSSNNIYAAGYVNGTSSYGFGSGITVAAAGDNTNATLVKYDSSGAAQWAKSTTVAPGYSQFTSVAVDSSNNSYAVGFLDGNGTDYNFGSGITVNGADLSDDDAFLVKYDGIGTPQLAKGVTSADGYTDYWGASVDSNGNVVAVGDAGNNDTFGFGNSVTVNPNWPLENILVVQYGEGNSPAPTPAPGNSSSSTAGTPSCSDLAPTNAPNLFQIDAAGTYVNLYFAGATGTVSGYNIYYGLTSDANQFSDSFDYGSGSWVIGRTISRLSPHTTYYFKVQAKNGCNAGPLSKTMSTRTGSILSNVTQFFANLSPFKQTPQISNKVLGVNTSCEYTVQGGDNLWNIAAENLGSGPKYTELIDLNKGTYPGIDTYLIQPGWQLKTCSQ